MFFQRLLAKVLLALAALVVAFTIGHSVGSDREKAKQVDKLTQAQTESNREVIRSQEESKVIEGKVSESAQLIERVEKLAVERTKESEPKVITKVVTKYIGVPNDDSSNANPSVNGETVIETSSVWTFDNGVIRLLNAARSNDTTDASNSNDASDQTPSSVRVSDLVANDLKVVGLYHELAERHKGLQDYISNKQEEGYMLCKHQ